jgi:hypothetical protein
MPDNFDFSGSNDASQLAPQTQTLWADAAANYLGSPANPTPQASPTDSSSTSDPWQAAARGPYGGYSSAEAKDLFDRLGGKNPVKEALESAWDWANKPLWNLNSENEGGITGGLKDVASGFTTPLSIGLTIGTAGGSTVLEAAAPVFKALGVAEHEIPFISSGIKALVSGGLTAQQAVQAVQESPRVLDALKEGDYENAKRMAVHVATAGLGAAFGTRELVPAARTILGGDVPPSPTKVVAKRELGRLLADQTENAQNAKLFIDTAKDTLAKDDPVTLGAISRYIEAGGDVDLLKRRREVLAESEQTRKAYSQKERDELLAKYDRAQNLTEDEQAFADKIRDHLSDNFELAYQHGIINHAVENYLTHIWEKPEQNPAVNSAMHETETGQFRTNVSMARQRVFDSTFTGEKLGYKLKNDDPAELAAYHTEAVNNAIASRDFLKRLRNLKTEDGRPMVAITGHGETVEDATFIHPNTLKPMRISNGDVAAMELEGTLPEYIENRWIAKIGVTDGKPDYAWIPRDYRVIDHPAMRDWTFAASDTAGNPVFVNSELRVHPDAVPFVRQALDADHSSFRENPITNALLKASAQAKGGLLAFSPFHLVQEGLRAVMTGVSPFGVEKWNLSTDPVLRTGVENGLTLGKTWRGQSLFDEGLSGANTWTDKVPVLGHLQTRLHKFLFDDYIPSLKARAYRNLVERYRAANPEWSFDRVAQEAAADTNSRFGGLNYKMLGRTLGGQDAARLALLAPDWLESEVRFMARALNPGAEGSIARQDLTRIGLYTFAAARVLTCS